MAKKILVTGDVLKDIHIYQNFLKVRKPSICHVNKGMIHPFTILNNKECIISE